MKQSLSITISKESNINQLKSKEVHHIMQKGINFYQELYPEGGNASEYLTNMDELISKNASIYVAKSNQSIIGMGAVIYYDGYAEFKRLYVDPSMRGHGIGKSIFLALENDVKFNQCNKICLETGIRQLKAIKLYKSLGYTEVEPYGDHEAYSLCIFLSKSLKF
eukprot:NODE_789_length_3873_cov_0.228405.p3 type:complete len:164 gc:universal NODE_789_length_3873_cov_0.228405:3070-3561(+)